MKEQLIHYMQQTGMTQTQVAKALGKSNAVISQYLKGEYKGRVDEIDQAVERLISRQKDKVIDRKFDNKFVPTFVAKQCLDVLHIAHVEGEINVITGEAGLGKTQALKQYKNENPEVILIEVEPSCSPKVLLKTLCQQLNVNDTGANHDLFSRITDKLGNNKGFSRLIIVDEAELLSTKSLEYLRRIHDLTGCGLVLAGMPRLIVNLKGKYGELAQLYSRVALACDLGNSLPDEDVCLLAENGLGTSAFNQKLIQASKGNARRLNKLMRGVIRIAEINHREIDDELIDAYAKMLIH